MAALTNANFDIPSPQRGAVTPQQPGSILTSLLGGVNNVLEGVQSKFYNDRLDQEKENQAGLNQAARGIFDTDQKANTTAGVPPAAVEAVKSLDVTKAGVDQGVLPSTAYSAQLQAKTAEVMAAHPDSAYSVMEYMQRSGHYSAMFPQLEAQQKAQQMSTDTVMAGQKDDYNYYIAHGGIPGASLESGVAAGQMLRKAEFEQQQASAAATASRENANADQTQYAFQQTQLQKYGMAGVQTEIMARVGPISEQFMSLMQNVPPDQFQKVSDNVVTQIDAINAVAERSAITHLTQLGIATKDNLETIHSYLGSITNGMKTVFADKSGESAKALTNMQTTFKLNFAQAAPLYWQMSQILGANQASALFGSTSLMDPEIIKKVSAELNGFVAGTPQGQVAVNDIISILHGDKSLEMFDQKTAASYIGAIVTGKNSSEKAILSGNGTSVDTNVYMNSMSNVMNAVHSLTPANDANDLISGSKLIANQGTRQAIDKLAADPATRERGEMLGKAAHLASIKLLQDFNQNASGTSVGGIPTGVSFQKITFDKASGSYKVIFDKSVFDKGEVGQDKSLYAQRLLRAQNAPVFAGLKARVDAMNAALDNAVKTSKWDETIPKNATPLQLRQAFGTNTPIPTATDGKKPVDTKQQWMNAEQALEDTMHRFSLTVGSQDAQMNQPGGAAGSSGTHKNNPLNLRASPSSFQEFGSMDEGVKAADNNLMNYPSKHGADTLASIISTWAPKSDHNNTDAYIKNVSKETGFDPNEKLDISNPHVRAILLSAMSRQEGTPLSVGSILKAQTGGK